MRSVGDSAWLSSWCRTPVVIFEDIFLMLGKVSVCGIGAHKSPVFGKDNWRLFSVFQGCVEAVIMIHGRASLKTSLLLIFIIIRRLVAPFTRTRCDRRRCRSSHLILVDLR